MMKTKLIYYLYGMGITLLLSVGACTDYLDKAPESIISPEDAFKDYRNFQGFVERMYHLTPDVSKHFWVSSFNWGEDEVVTLGNGEYLMGFAIDRGNYRAYINKGDSFLDRGWSAGGDRFQKSIWGGSWHGIRTANMGLEALEAGLMTDATQAERDMIRGQLYFFRAWFHFQLTTYWGGLPYVDQVLPSDELLTLPRETYRENAEKMAADFKRAADLLPVNWDDTEIGRRTAGNNALRVNKIWALSMLGKTYLYAGSPLMSQGVNGTPLQYDAEMCKLAADVFGQVLSMVENGETQYALVPFEDYSTLFYTIQQGWLMPGGTEAIIRSPTYGPDSYWRQMNSYQPSPMAEGDGIVLAPAANYVNYFGMANGLPLADDDSGFSETQPWMDRDPRFYHSIIYDGVRVVADDLTGDNVQWQYANLHTGGSYVNDPRTVSRTGYLNYKFIPLGANRWDQRYGYGLATHMHLSWLRLADVYLMYAEATAQGYGVNASAPTFSTMTAVDAVNRVRERAGVEGVHSKYTGSAAAFMSEVIRERAVELSFEGHRFNDLRRWLLLTEYPYNVKTRQHFDRATPLDPDADPRENSVLNWREEVIVERNLTNRHYWLPLKTEDVSIYPELYQNPGW